MTFRTRFAPSPTGYLHLGHAYSALLAAQITRAQQGEFILRIEDTDTARCRPEYEAAIFEDLLWLGLAWPEPVWRQSERLDTYDRALDELITSGWCYPCSCSRGDIRAALAAPQEGATLLTPDGVVYPGTCRNRAMSTRKNDDCIRLNMSKILDEIPDLNDLSFTETGDKFRGTHRLNGANLLDEVGDIVLARRDISTASYHLSVVVDDAAQGITHIIRGQDLYPATGIHRLLQRLLELPTPTYFHHRLIRDEKGKRLAKRDDARAIRTLRDTGVTVSQIHELVGL